MSLRETLSNYWYAFQQELFPGLETNLAPLTQRYELFGEVVEFVRREDLLPYLCGLPGHPPQDCAALARAFLAKAVDDLGVECTSMPSCWVSSKWTASPTRSRQSRSCWNC